MENKKLKELADILYLKKFKDKEGRVWYSPMLDCPLSEKEFIKWVKNIEKIFMKIDFIPSYKKAKKGLKKLKELRL